MQAQSLEAPDVAQAPDTLHQPRLWQDRGWTARIVKNNDDEGWAVEMIKAGEPEPALVGPWTMGRDKKNPKPLDTAAFNTLVKTANEVLRRAEQALADRLHKQVRLDTPQGPVTVMLDIVADEDNPHAVLAARDAHGAELGQQRVGPDFKLSAAGAAAWVDGGCLRMD
jgi:hypothetical protein